MTWNRYVLYGGDQAMSDLEVSMPSRADIMSVIGGLEGLRPAAVEAPPAPSQPDPARATQSTEAAQARHDQDAAALRDMTADRDSWRTAAQQLQTELWRQMDAFRTEAAQHRSYTEALRVEVEQQRVQLDTVRVEAQTRDGQIAHLSAAMTALLALAQARPEPLAAMPASPVAPPTPGPPPAAQPSTEMAGYVMPSGMEGIPRTQPPAPPVDPNAAPMVIPSLAPETRAPAKTTRLGAVTPVAIVKQPVKTEAVEPAVEPTVEAEPAPPAVEFTAPEPPSGGIVILPEGAAEKKRRRARS
jgi:hypothetical protein